MLLSELALGVPAAVERVRSTSALVGSVALHRLEELGFIAGERVQVVRRGPGGREPLAVQVGDTFFALRLLEAQCIEVSLVG